MPENTIRLVLLDADALSVADIAARLRLHEDFEVVCETTSSADTFEKISVLRPDAILLNVEMLESFDMARLLNQPSRPTIVFLTANRDYAFEAFEFGAADYLLKPISSPRLEMCLNRIREQFILRRLAKREAGRAADVFKLRSLRAPVPVRIAVTDRRKTRLIEAQEIEWIGAACDYTELHIGDRTFLLREPISVLLGRLPASSFCRIHRSFAVNLNRVTGFVALRNQDLLVKLKDKTVLRASRTFSDGFRRAIIQH